MKTAPTRSMTHLVRLYVRTAQLVWQAAPLLALGTTALMLLGAVIAPLQVWITKLMIDSIAAIVSRSEHAGWQSLVPALALYVGVWAVAQVSQSVSADWRELLSVRTSQYGQHLILKKAATLDLAFLENSSLYDILSLSLRELWRLNAIVFSLWEIAVRAITLVSLLILLGQLHWLLPVILVLTALPRLLLQSRFSKRKYEIYNNHLPSERMADYMAWLLGAHETAKEIRLFQLQEELLKHHSAAHQRFYQDLLKVTTAQEWKEALLALISLAGTAGIWAFTGFIGLAGRITLGDVALAFQAVERSRAALDQLTIQIAVVAEHALFLHHLFEFLDLAPDAVQGSLTRLHAATQQPPDMNGTIEFRHVSFRYPGAERDALTDVSFTIRPGEKVALVGENGSGKTTLVKLLARLYDPTAGAITLNGRDLREIDPQAYYAHLGVIFQDFVHFDLTVKENIGFGNVSAQEETERVQRAAKLGGAAELIHKLPQQYETMLGKRFEGGVDLSGGEWQKMALSRAFMRDAEVLILDEPTSALDAYAESEVYRRFAEMTQGRTTVFVTHRLSSVHMADKILVLKEGRLVEEGNHDSLMALGGEYAHMFNLQAEHYQQPGDRLG
jgi:ATP-binding cassette subfamily B protein